MLTGPPCVLCFRLAVAVEWWRVAGQVARRRVGDGGRGEHGEQQGATAGVVGATTTAAATAGGAAGGVVKRGDAGRPPREV